MNLLALDTSSEGCSAALLTGDQLSERFQLAPRGHTRLLMPMVRELLREHGLAPADLDVLAFACGPGSFTGLRIATGVVQGLAWALQLPVVPVSSLAAVAYGAICEHELADGQGVAVAFDARMDEVYWGCYLCRQGLPQALAEERVCSPEAVTLPAGASAWIGAGAGWQYRERMPAAVREPVTRTDTGLTLRAGWVARLAQVAAAEGRTLSAAEAQPVYLRDEVAWKKLPGRA